MTIMMRDCADGQVEVVILRPEVIGVLSDRAMASRFVAFLQSEDPELVTEEPAGFATAAADVADAERLDLEEVAPPVAAPIAPRRIATLPAVVSERPTAPVFVAAPKTLTEAEIDAAFERIHRGEKLTAVAASVGITMGRLRGMWASHLKQLQRHMAEGGQQPCGCCQRPFTPSVSSPDKCARCNRG